jgi:hypothetical protein
MRREAWAVAGVAAFIVLSGGAGVVLYSEMQKRVKRLADAIEHAEGYGVPGARPTRNQNPGDLTSDLIGKAVGWDGSFPIYATYADGRANLETEVEMMLDGTSSIYDPTMSISEVAALYTTTQQAAWATNVAGYLGVDVSTPINTIPV